MNAGYETVFVRDDVEKSCRRPDAFVLETVEKVNKVVEI